MTPTTAGSKVSIKFFCDEMGERSAIGPATFIGA
jgi:hypothetical protein